MNATSANKSIILITGVMAAGKSSVAQSLAEQLNPSIHLRGDVFRRMIVNGRKDMGTAPMTQAIPQLTLRYQISAAVAREYYEAGFHVIYQDVIIGSLLSDVVSLYKNLPLQVVVLCPSTTTIAQREQNRAKTGYGSVSIDQLQSALGETPKIGFWLDSSEQTVAETTTAILDNLSQAKVG